MQNNSFFYHSIFSRSRLRLWVPYTVVYGVEENPVMFFTDERDGCVVRVDNVSVRTILKKLTINAENENEITVVSKRVSDAQF